MAWWHQRINPLGQDAISYLLRVSLIVRVGVKGNPDAILKDVKHPAGVRLSDPEVRGLILDRAFVLGHHADPAQHHSEGMAGKVLHGHDPGSFWHEDFSAIHARREMVFYRADDRRTRSKLRFNAVNQVWFCQCFIHASVPKTSNATFVAPLFTVKVVVVFAVMTGVFPNVPLSSLENCTR